MRVPGKATCTQFNTRIKYNLKTLDTCVNYRQVESEPEEEVHA